MRLTSVIVFIVSMPPGLEQPLRRSRLREKLSGAEPILEEDMALPRVLFSAVRNFKRAFPLMRDERVPLQLKVITGLLALLIISPLDVFSDIPVLGLFDDAVLLTLLCALFVMLATRTIEKNVTLVRQPTAGLPRLP
jgi:uncharacterized membrane protein YkvA (DUF1232 family)